MHEVEVAQPRQLWQLRACGMQAAQRLTDCTLSRPAKLMKYTAPSAAGFNPGCDTYSANSACQTLPASGRDQGPSCK